MDSWVIIMMLSVSVFLGSIALAGIMWAIRSGQFDDREHFLHQVQYDGEDELNDAAKQVEKKKAMKAAMKEKKEAYKPE